MIDVAVLITVYNRKNITLRGLRSLFSAVKNVSEFSFDIYMLDDNSVDGTAEAVAHEFPVVHIIKGDGGSFWSGGTRLAWEMALKAKDYDYFILFNDDAEIYPTALTVLFEADAVYKNNAIVSGAFCDDEGRASYGGRDKTEKIISPNGSFQEIYLMNGNLVLIPRLIVKTIGIIDSVYRHSLGDWDYGCRAIKAGFKVVLSKNYVGKTNRHDMCIATPFLSKYPLKKRLELFYSPKYNPKLSWTFNIRHMGLKKALRTLIIEHLYVFLPFVAICVRKLQKKG